MAKRFLTPINLLNRTSDPATATEGDIYFNSSTDKVRIYYNSAWNDIAPSSSAAYVTISDTPPTSPSAGEMWFESDSGNTFIYYDSTWIQINGTLGSAITVSSAQPQSPEQGDAWLDSDNDYFYVYDGTTWVRLATIPVGGAAGDILAKIDATDYNVEWIPNYTSQVKHYIKAAESISKGQAVYVSSATGTIMLVSKASNESDLTSARTLGLLAQSLATNDQGFVVTEGLLSGLDTSTATAGDPVWLGTAGNLIFGFANKPHAPSHLVYLGVVTRVNAINGEIFVKVQNGYEIDELHDVLITNKQDKDAILYDSATGLWKNNGTYLLNISATSQTKAGPLGVSILDLNETELSADIKTINVTSSFLIDSFSSTLYRSAEYLFQFSQGTNYGITKLLLIHNGTDIAITEYGHVEIGTPIPYEFAGAFSLGNLELTITCSNANITPIDLKISRVLFDV